MLSMFWNLSVKKTNLKNRAKSGSFFEFYPEKKRTHFEARRGIRQTLNIIWISIEYLNIHTQLTKGLSNVTYVIIQQRLKAHWRHIWKCILEKSLTNATFVIMQQPSNQHCKLIFLYILGKDPINVISAIVHSRVPRVYVNIWNQRSINATLWSTLRLNDWAQIGCFEHSIQHLLYEKLFLSH